MWFRGKNQVVHKLVVGSSPKLRGFPEKTLCTLDTLVECELEVEKLIWSGFFLTLCENNSSAG